MAGLRLWQGEAAGGTTLAARHSYQDRSKIGWFRGPRFPVRSRGVLSVSEIVLWLLKNSRSRRSQKFHSARMPYKRRSRFWWTFSIPRLGQFFQKRGFFNSHRQLHSLPPREGPHGLTWRNQAITPTETFSTYPFYPFYPLSCGDS